MACEVCESQPTSFSFLQESNSTPSWTSRLVFPTKSSTSTSSSKAYSAFRSTPRFASSTATFQNSFSRSHSSFFPTTRTAFSSSLLPFFSFPPRPFPPFPSAVSFSYFTVVFVPFSFRWRTSFFLRRWWFCTANRLRSSSQYFYRRRRVYFTNLFSSAWGNGYFVDLRFGGEMWLFFVFVFGTFLLGLFGINGFFVFGFFRIVGYFLWLLFGLLLLFVGFFGAGRTLLVFLLHFIYQYQIKLSLKTNDISIIII